MEKGDAVKATIVDAKHDEVSDYYVICFVLDGMNYYDSFTVEKKIP